MPEPRRGPKGLGTDPGVGGASRAGAASGEDPHRGGHAMGWIRLPGLALRAWLSMVAGKEPSEVEGENTPTDSPQEWTGDERNRGPAQSHAARLARLLQSWCAQCAGTTGPNGPAALAHAAAQTAGQARPTQ